MTLCLQMNGTNSQLKTPSISFNKIVLDILTSSSQPQTNYTLIDARSGSTGLYESSYFTGFTAKLNGVANSSNFSTFPKDTRITVELNTTSSAVYTDDVNIFSRNNNTNFMHGNIYSVKFYNGATLVASYDMTSGNVNDQSGNGFNATLTNGVFADDGLGGTGTTYTGTGTAMGSESLTSADIVIQSSNGMSQSIASLNTVEHDILALNGLSNGISSLLSSEHIIQTPLETVIGIASLTSSEEFISILGTIFSEGVLLQGLSFVVANERMIHAPFTIPAINLNGHTLSTIQLKGHAQQIIILNGKASSTIQLKGGKL